MSVGWAVTGAIVASAVLGLTVSGSRGQAVPEASPEYGARVRVVAPALGRGWHTGLVGQVGSCLAVMVPSGRGGGASFDVVQFAQVDSLRLSTRYPGTPDARGRPRVFRDGADTVGERWVAVPLAPLRARYADCSPF